MLTQQYIKKIIHYNPDTGICTWLDRDQSDFDTKRSWGIFQARYAGKRAGHLRANGYFDIWICGRLRRLHRIAFLYMTGENPVGQIDHIDHNRSNNKWENLRDVTPLLNRKNMSKKITNTSGFTGVSYHKKTRKWVAEAIVNYKKYYLGLFEDINDAVAARSQFNASNNFHKNHGT